MLAVCGGRGPLNLPLPSHHRACGGGAVAGCCCCFLKERRWRRVGEGSRSVAVRAQLSSLFSSSRIGLDSQVVQTNDISQLLWIGPVPGDIAEVEAYCRIFRAAEQLHAVIMETLCNPETGECSVSYDTPSEEMPLLEEKVVAVLGCMLALLNRGREDVLSGRSSFMNSFEIAEVNIVDSKLPPLAVFRGEMKRCCESLDVALGNYLTPLDDRSTNIWRQLQRLKNVCYDAGFSRKDGYPCPTLFANFSPVDFSSVKDGPTLNESEVAFWRGGQVTDEGLTWLLEKGYRTIVDLREEAVKEDHYQSAIRQAVSCSKIEVINIPVEVGTAPSMEQVEKFATLVWDPQKRPLYLHSQEGVGRTSAMVSRWRQYITRSRAQCVTKLPFSGKLKKASDVEEHLEMQKDGHANSQGGSLASGNTSLQSELHCCSSLNGIHGDHDISAVEDDNQNGKLTCHNDATSNGTDGIDLSYDWKFPIESNPLKAQFPTCDIFCKKEMSSFFKSRKFSPRTCLNSPLGGIGTSPETREKLKLPIQSSKNLVNGQVSDWIQSGGSNDMYTDINYVSNGKHPNWQASKSLVESNGFEEGRSPSVAFEPQSSSNVSSNFAKQSLSTTVEEKKSMNTTGSMNSLHDSLEVVEGNMCASATGVVRVQSRKKAEMFLVRTDGFSCIREKVTESSLAFTHPTTQQQMLMWKSPPKTVLLLKKLGLELMEEAKEVASFLHYEEKMNVLVEPDVHDIFARIPGFGFIQTFYSHDTSDLHERVDFVACLGGDGVILHASNLFRAAVPPVVSFNLGSLGFLTSHTFHDYRQDLRAVIHGNNSLDGVYITLRMRLRCEMFRNGKAMPGKVFDVLNEVIVDRGSNPYLSKIECYEHNRLITKVQGDGVIVATPTGSTAYSTAAGGSMVHPNVPCMLFTPICPHSLSFRPVILPDSAQLELKIPDKARSNAWVSFDGKRRQQLSRGDSVRISMSQHPLPTVNKSDQTGDWFHSLVRCLNWNERLDQKALWQGST